MEKSKVSGSFRMCPTVKKNVETLAKKENRSFNNMLEELARRQCELEKKPLRTNKLTKRYL